MSYSEQRLGKVLVVTLDRRLDMAEGETVMASFDEWSKNGDNFVFDCGKLEFMDSSGLGILLRMLKRAISDQKDIRLAAVGEQVRMLFEITRADQIFQLYADVEEAVQSFGKK